MTSIIQFAVLGIGIGAVYTLLAQGLVVAYGGSGVLNLAQGAMALLGVFGFYELVNSAGWTFWPAFAVSVAGLAVLGVLIQLCVMGPMRNSSAIAKAIATLGILICIQGGVGLALGDSPRSLTQFLPMHLFIVRDVALTSDRLLLLAIATGLTVALSLVYRRTTLGLAIRAGAENEIAVRALGWSPNKLATFTWGLGAGLAGAAGILVAPLTGISVSEMPLLVVPVLAAALLAGFESFTLVLIGSLVIGIAQSEMARYVTLRGAADSFPFAVIVILLVVRGRGLPLRGEAAPRLPRIGTGRVRPGVVLAVSVFLVALLLAGTSDALVIAITVTLIWAIILLSLVVLLGYTGQLSLAQFAIGGTAAMIASRLVANNGWPFAAAFAAGVLAVIPVGVLFAIPALRTRGINLAIVTLGLGLTVSAMVFENTSLTGGGVDGTVVGYASLFGLDVDMIRHPQRYGVLVLCCFLVCALGVANLRRGRTGGRLIAVRTNERAAAALGISVFRVKLFAFAVSAALAGVGGVLLGFRNSVIVFGDYQPFQSILAVAYTVIGGAGFIVGTVSGATLASGGFGTWISASLYPSLSPLWLSVLGGATVIVFVILSPNGIVGAHVDQYHWLVARIRRSRTRPVPERIQAVEVEEGPPHRVPPATLEVKNVTVAFGAVVAVADVSVTVRTGEVHGLIGPNGAGKSTLIDAITGFNRPAAGDVLLDGRRINGWPAHRRARAGIGRSFQSLELFETETLDANLRVASDPGDATSYLSDLVWPRGAPLTTAAVAALRDLELEPYLHVAVEDLPYGRRRLAAIARAIAAEPSILLLDEPASGLSSSESEELRVVIRRLVDEWGLGVVIVEHDIPFVMNLCDRITVLDFGHQIASGSPEDIRSHPAVIAAYLGVDEPELSEVSR